MDDISGLAIVGTKQVLKAIAANELDKMYLALDVDASISQKLTQAATAAGVQIITVSTMKELGEACKIDVGAACAGIPRA